MLTFWPILDSDCNYLAESAKDQYSSSLILPIYLPFPWNPEILPFPGLGTPVVGDR